MEDAIEGIHDICLDDNLEQEKDDGNIEYKRELLNLDEETVNRRMTQMKYRIYEGLGEALYFIGVADDGSLIGLNEEEYKQSALNLEMIATRINCFVLKISESNKKNQYVGKYLIRENNEENYIELKIGVAGNVDSGKSTTIGTLSSLTHSLTHSLTQVR